MRVTLNPYINDAYTATGAECVSFPLQFLSNCGFTKVKMVEAYSNGDVNVYYNATGKYGYDLSPTGIFTLNEPKDIDYSDMSLYLGLYISMSQNQRANIYAVIEFY